MGSIQWKENDSLICTNCNPPKEDAFTLLRKMYERKQKFPLSILNYGDWVYDKTIVQNKTMKHPEDGWKHDIERNQAFNNSTFT